MFFIFTITDLAFSINEYPFTLINDSSILLTSIATNTNDNTLVDINSTLTTLLVSSFIMNTSDANISIVADTYVRSLDNKPFLNILLVTSSPSFTAFHTPKQVSIIVDSATIKIMPLIGAKNKTKAVNTLPKYPFILPNCYYSRCCSSCCNFCYPYRKILSCLNCKKYYLSAHCRNCYVSCSIYSNYTSTSSIFTYT